MGQLKNVLQDIDLLPVYVSVAVGTAVFLLAMLAIRGMRARQEVRRRTVGEMGMNNRSLSGAREQDSHRVLEKAARFFTGADRATTSSLRRELIRAGYFASYAPAIYNAMRLLVAVALPALFLASVPFLPFQIPLLVIALVAIALTLLGVVLVPILLDFRIAVVRDRYRNIFPDMMDLLVVCVESGQSMQSALDQVGQETIRMYPPLGFNLHLLSLELRAGGTIETALANLHARMGLDELKSLSVLLRQSEELGSSISGALRVFSDEMRDKRLMRAETKANLLPVKMTVPLGLFIFPVILLVILVPIVIRVKNAFV